MRTFILATCAMILLVGCSQNKCVIIGDVTGLDGNGKMYLMDEWNGYSVIDSADVVDGVFRFELEVERPTSVYLYFNNQVQIRDFILEPGIIEVCGDFEADLFSGAKGTEMNDRLNAFKNEIPRLLESMPMDKVLEKQDEVFYDILHSEGMDALKLTLATGYVGVKSSFEILQCLNSLPDYMKEMEFVQKNMELCEKRIRTEPKVEGSSVIPYYIDMIYPDASGRDVTLKSIVEKADNRYVLIDFWATWCGPCRESVPEMVEAYEKYKDKGFEIYAVSFDRDTDQWRGFIKENAWGWVNVIAESGSGFPKCWTDYGLNGIPDNVLIDCSSGLIIGRMLQGRLVSVLDTLFEE